MALRSTSTRLPRTLHLEPRLPATWDFAELSNVRIGDDFYKITFTREHDHLLVVVHSEKPTVLCVNGQSEDLPGSSY